jgi:hypothetical protein
MNYKKKCVRLRAVLAPLSLTLLTACVTPTSDVCPTLFVYSAARQAIAADELAALPEPSTLAEMIADYGVVREQIRVCSGA